MARKKSIKAEEKALKPVDESYYSVNDNFQVGTNTLLYGGVRTMIRAGVTYLHYLGNNILPYGIRPKERDFQLWGVLHNNSWLSSVYRNVSIRLESIPYKIVARNPSVTTHVELAEQFNKVFWYGDKAIMGSKGWHDVSDRFIENVLCQDNGGVLEILDSAENIRRRPDLPRLGFGGFRFWDSSQVIRKNDDEFPVAILYKPEGGKQAQYKLHTSRVFSIVDMESTKPELNGIGYCAVSRALDFFSDLSNLTQVKKENYGDAEPDQVWVLSSDSIPQVSDGDMYLKQIESTYHINQQNSGTTKTAKRLKVELPTGSTFDIKNARTLPDGFDESETIDNAMKGMASAWLVPLRFIWTITTAGLGDKSAADLDQEIAESGMFTWFTKKVIGESVTKILPITNTLDMIVNATNDKQDLQASEIESNITDSNSKQLADGVIDIRAYRLALLESGKLSEAEFERLELEDGRTVDGSPLIDKFYDPSFDDVLTIQGIDDPLDVDANANEEIVKLLGTKARQVKRLRESIKDDGRRVSERERLRIAHFALMRLQDLYMERLNDLEGNQDNSDNSDNRPEQDTGEQSEDEVKQIELDTNEAEYFKQKEWLKPSCVMDENGNIETLFGYPVVYIDDEKKKTTKAVNDDLDLYQRKLEEILLRTNNGEIDEDESKDRISALAKAMLLIAFLLGKRERQNALTPDEGALVAGARLILNNGGITNATMTAEQLQRYTEGLEVVNDETLKASVLNDDELKLINDQNLINDDSSKKVVDFALELTPVLVGLGLVGREFDNELLKRIKDRVNIWRNKASALVDVGKVSIRPFTNFQWKIMPNKDSCETCLFYNGQIKTGAEWFRLAVDGIYPRSHSLSCGGWNCGCYLVKM